MAVNADMIPSLMIRIDRIVSKINGGKGIDDGAWGSGMVFQWAKRYSKNTGLSYQESLLVAAEHLENGRTLPRQ